MTITFQGFHEQFLKELKEEIDSRVDYISRGKMETFDAYKSMTGNIAGLRFAAERYQELLDNMEQANDR